jgi:hypothetical protein
MPLAAENLPSGCASTNGWQQIELSYRSSGYGKSGSQAQIVPYGMKLLNPPEKDGKPGV